MATCWPLNEPGVSGLTCRGLTSYPMPSSNLPVAPLDRGWLCPRCSKVNSPYKTQCDCVAFAPGNGAGGGGGTPAITFRNGADAMCAKDMFFQNNPNGICDLLCFCPKCQSSRC